MQSPFQRAIELIDSANAEDPNRDEVDGERIPRELLYARRLTEWVFRLEPNASEALRLAARSQHIRRWEVPRASYPADRAGYHKWKNALKRFHADTTRQILEQAGCDRETIEKVRTLNLKENFPSDSESQVLEDALCLVFLEHQLSDLARKTESAKVVNALRKSWNKMSPKAREEAQRLRYGETAAQLLSAALTPHPASS